MTVIRAIWLGIAAVAVGLTVLAGTSSGYDVAMSCGKTGELSFAGAAESARCEDSMFEALGPWPILILGILLVAPPLLAAMVLRWWFSWIVVAVQVILAIVGLGNWTTFWGFLMYGAPLAVVGMVVAMTQTLKRRTSPTVAD